MTSRGVGSLAGVPPAWASYAWDSAYLGLFTAASIWLVRAAPAEPAALLGLGLTLSGALWIAVRVATQVRVRRAGHAVRVVSSGSRVRLSTVRSPVTGLAIAARPGETVRVAVGAGSSAPGPLLHMRDTYLPRHDHVRLTIIHGWHVLEMPLYVRPQQSWIAQLVADIEREGLTVEFIP